MPSYGGFAKSLAFNDGSAKTLSSIKSYEIEHLGAEPVAFRDGSDRIEGHYQGTQTASIMVEVTDMDLLKAGGLSRGKVVTAVVLTVTGAVRSDGTTENADLTASMSRAVVEEVSAVGRDSEDGAPATFQVRFRLSKLPGAAAPTFVVAGGAT